MNTNEIVGIGVMILCGVVLVVQILGLLLSIFKKMTTPNVEKLKTRRDKKALIKALRYKDKDVRYAAAEALGRLRWKPAKDETAGWYWMAKRDWDKCVALGALAVEPLSAALKDEEWDVRQAAARALGKIKDPRAVKPLIAALKDEKWDVRQAAAEALGEIGAPAVEPLIATLKDKDSDVRQAAAEALGKIGDAHAVEPLIAALKDKDSDVRQAAAYALGEIQARRAVEPLFGALKDELWCVRQAAAEALG
jgi:HEAT repeat protein